jgi:hypothetical protein
METLRTAAAVTGSILAVGGGDLALNVENASAAPVQTGMEHVLTQTEQARYNRTGLDIGAMTLRMPSTKAESPAEQPQSSEEYTGWTIYGGDPLFDGGVHSETQLAHQVFSPKGQDAIHLMLNSTEIKAVEQGVKEGDEKLQHMPFGTFETIMSYGTPTVALERRVRFEDPSYKSGFDAYVLDAKVVNTTKSTVKVHGETTEKITDTSTENIYMDWPTKCANMGLLKISHVYKKIVHKIKHPIHHPKHHIETGKIYVGKDAVGSNGKELPVFPTGEFDGDLIYKTAQGKKVDKHFVLESQTQLEAKNAKVGTKAELIEDAPVHDASDWEFITPKKQNFIVRAGKNLLGMKDKEKASPVVTKPPIVVKTPPITVVVPPNSTPTPVPGITISKAFVGSYLYDGTEYSDVATEHGDTDEWEETVTNNGQDALNAVYSDTPPAGEQNIEEVSSEFPAQPAGLSVNTNGVSTWSNVLEPGQSVTFYTYTENEDVACYTNVVNTVDVTGTDSYGQTVSSEAIAYTKEENTGQDCISTPPPVTGPGQ